MSDGDDHRHCKVCGKVCAVGKETCSNACRDVLEQRQQSRRNSVRLMYLLIFVVVVAFALELVH